MVHKLYCGIDRLGTYVEIMDNRLFAVYRQMVWYSRVSRVTIKVSLRIRIRFDFIGPPYH